MRIHASRAFAAALALAASGCLGNLIPDHSTGGGDDLGAAAGAGGNGGESQLPSSGNGGNIADVDGGTGTGGGGGGGGGAARDPNCIEPATPVLDGHHNAGTACLGCHDGNTATKFTAGGTVYDNAGKALSGVTVELVDAKGVKVSVVSASQGAAGNFYTSAALAFPVTVRGSKCPYDRPMTAKLAAATDGNCARSGCHGPAMPIHVP
ncbi:MAG: hypothetical protein JWN44_5757 [Myxococcales bacterium]|nr:hypothetical protein [Myxococcales bacterium]